MVREVFAGLKEVRPGRTLFVREWILGAPSSSKEDHHEVDLDLVCVHGSCATEAQFHEMCRELCDQILTARAATSNQAQEQTTRSSSKKQPLIRCILYDMLGCGQSPVVQNWDAYAPDELEQDLGAIVQLYARDPISKSSSAASSVPLYFCSHSYGPHIVLSWLKKQQDKEQEEIGTHSNNNTKDSAASIASVSRRVHGFIFLGTCVEPPYAEGGHMIFRLPLWVLRCIQSYLTRAFVEKSIHPSNHSLRKFCLSNNDKNDMFMVQAFYRQTKWMTPDDFQKSIIGPVILGHDKGVGELDQNDNARWKSRRMLAIHGVEDGILSVESGQYMVNFLKSQSQRHEDGTKDYLEIKFVTIEKASHLVHLEKAREVAMHIHQFLQS